MMLGVAANALAQEELVITGTVTDANGEPIIGANISRKDDPGLGAITKESTRLLQSNIRLLYSHTLVSRRLRFSSRTPRQPLM